MARFVRALAVIALALSPVWGVPSIHAQHASYPTYPAFLANQCNGVSGTNVTLACAQNGFVLTQVLSGYACNELDIDVTDVSGGPFLLTATAQSGSVNNNVSISGPGVYYMRFPFFLTDNLIAIQITATGQGSMTIADIGAAPCPVATDTPTINPSSTSTNTPVPVTGTPTPIPTFTPLPSGHSTFTATATPTPSETALPTSTPPPGAINCGEPTYPLLNCNMVPYLVTSQVIPPTHWTLAGCSGWSSTGSPFGRQAGNPSGFYNYNGGAALAFWLDNAYDACVNASQSVTIPASGTLYVHVSGKGGHWLQAASFGNTAQNLAVGTNNLGHVNAGAGGLYFSADQSCCIVNGYDQYTIDDVYVVPDAPWTPGPTSTATATPTIPAGTATAIAQETLTAVASSFTPTPIPIPGAPETPIPTSTECPGGCAVAAMTQIPGMATVVHVDTSPFDPLKNLSLTRSTCQPFGYVQIPMPVIHGTPALGSTTPLSVTWTTPITGPWDNSIVSGTIVLTNTAVQPCAMSEIPTFVWDLTYWLSVLMCAIAWFLWLIGFVGRLSGEETING